MDITNINHVGMAVRHLAAATARYEAMGFQLTPYSPHSAAWKPGDAVQPLGSGNRCIMFGNPYLEILASEDPKQPAPRITNFLRHHQGTHHLLRLSRLRRRRPAGARPRDRDLWRCSVATRNRHA